MPTAADLQHTTVLSVHLLGGFRAWVGASPVDEGAWRLRKARTLVKLLALAPEQRLHRERLLDLLWPDLPPEAAANNLRYVLHIARRALAMADARGVLQRFPRSEGELVLLCPPGALETDVAAFEAGAAAARRAQTVSAYGEAIARYGGELLPEDRYEDWAAGRREGLRNLYLALLLEQAGLAERAGAGGVAATTLERVLAVDPAHEGAHQALMRVHAQQGQRHLALRQYQQLREALRRELEAEPDPASQRLYQDILTGTFPPHGARPGAPATPGAPGTSGAPGATGDAAASAHPGGPLSGPPEPVGPAERVRSAEPLVGDGGDRRHNLPTPITSFVGRELERNQVARLLGVGTTLPQAGGGAGSGAQPAGQPADQSAGPPAGPPDGPRLVTLTGSGGCGKTRLALEVASRLLDAYPDGVWLVELAPLTDATLVAPAVAAAIGVREAPGVPPLEALARALRQRRLLLVLDNCEQLVDACATLVGALLRRCPGLRILATSREALGMAGEAAFRVPSLTLPASVATETSGERRPAGDVAGLMRYEAVRLFQERASFVVPGFSLTDENAPAVIQICRRLDGIPLAIELAAARLAVLSPVQLSERLDDRFRLLSGGNRAAPARHQTLRAVVDWSYDLLTPAERALFVRLSVFAGDFSLEAAEAICADDSAGTDDVLDGLDRLAAKSLVVAGAGTQGQLRYHLLETLRQYAEERLDAPAGPALRQRHADYFRDLAEEAAAQLHGPGQVLWLGRLESEHDNFRGALHWALEAGASETALRIAGALWWFWSTRGYLSEGRRWLERALAGGEVPDDGPAVLRSLALRGFGHLAAARGEYAPAAAAYAEALERFRAAGDSRGVAGVLTELGALARNQGDYQRAATLHEESLALHRAADDRRGMATSLNHLGGLARGRGDYAAAATSYGEALGLWRALGDSWGVANALDHLGVLARDLGDYRRATALHEESLTMRRELGDRAGIAYALNNLGAVARGRGDYAAAGALDAESLAIRRELGDRAGIATSLTNLASLARDQGEASRALALHEESLAIRRELGDRRGVAIALNNLGALARERGDFQTAAALHEESLAIRRELGDRWGIAYSLDHLGALARERGDFHQAIALYQASLRTFWELQNKGAVAGCLEGLAGVAALGERAARAATLLGAAAALREAIGAVLPPADRPANAEAIGAARARLGEAAFATAWAQGRAHPLAQAVALALSDDDVA